MAFEIKGIAPLMMHNGRLADPLDPVVKKIKAITDKKTKKTDADIEKLRRLEWEGSLYFDAKEGPFIPADAIERMIYDGAKKSKKGPSVLQGLVVLDDRAKLIYKGPRTLDKLFKNDDFVDRRGVKVQRNRVFRTRPIFKAWSLKFQVLVATDVLNPSDVEKAVRDAGRLVGLGDYRPKFGRFEVTSVN